MDPDTAFENILRGHMMVDHVEALHSWIKGGGFLPRLRPRPVDVPPCLAFLPFDVELLMDRYGLCIAKTGKLEVSWRELARMAIANDAEAD